MFVPMRMVVANRTNLPSYLRNMSMYRDELWERAHCSTNNTLWQEYTDYTLKFTKALNKFNRSIENRIIEKGNSQTI